MLKCILFKLLDFMCPPAGALRENHKLNKTAKEYSKGSKWQTEFNDWLERMRTDSNNSSLLAITEKIEESEMHRKEILESKASSVANTLGLSLVLMAIFPTLMGEKWGLSRALAIAAGVVFFLAIVHLLVAALYALAVNRVGAYYMFSSDSLKEACDEGSEYRKHVVAEKLANLRANQLPMTIKSNCLYVAQKLFERAIIFITIGILIFVFSWGIRLSDRQMNDNACEDSGIPNSRNLIAQPNPSHL